MQRFYDINKQEHDQTTYWGRLMHFKDITNPLGIFWTEKDLDWARERVNNYHKRFQTEGTSNGIMMKDDEIQEIRKAKKIINAVEHPDTKKPVFSFFRMNWFVPANMPLVFGLVCSKQTFLNIVFWQWMNQSYNSGLNYANRNKSSPFTNKELAQAYGGAVVTAVTISLGLRKLADKVLPPAKTMARTRLISASVASIAIGLASATNLLLIRQLEMKKGVHLYDPDGNQVGLSQMAAKKAVFLSALTRLVLPIPQIAIFPACFWLLEKMKVPVQKTFWRVTSDLGITFIALVLGLPMAIALFQQEQRIHYKEVEEIYQDRTDSKGNKIEYFTFNRGL